MSAAGSFSAYENRHIVALAVSFAPKLGIPPEAARAVVTFAFHTGCY